MTNPNPSAYVPTNVYFDVTTIAKMVRLTLKKFYPGVKFSVKIDRYSMGSSVKIQCDVMVPGAPSYNALLTLTNLFSTKGFDGLTDSTTYHPLTIDGFKINLNSFVHGQTDYRGGMDLTDADVTAITTYRDELIREFAPNEKRF